MSIKLMSQWEERNGIDSPIIQTLVVEKQGENILDIAYHIFTEYDYIIDKWIFTDKNSISSGWEEYEIDGGISYSNQTLYVEDHSLNMSLKNAIEIMRHILKLSENRENAIELTSKVSQGLEVKQINFQDATNLLIESLYNLKLAREAEDKLEQYGYSHPEIFSLSNKYRW
ncbi:hypothetical protein ABE237_00970 [Brevibacillus formosus]|uniref:hypothetical protein n=1 Tax=Brevibacillus formosus TaxID=54913 RepID=UPI0018CEDA22|nr:hypothetical protein [Brevibacillus formosus]MBG9944715.1 hypothetical protein [Brevibacillus formosus]